MERIILHYYGDRIRMLFLVAGVVYALRVLIFKDLLAFPISYSVMAMLALVLFAGVINPRQIWVIALNSIVSILSFIYFQLSTFSYPLGTNPYFIAVNQALAIIFFLATYFSVKSLRGILLGSDNS